MDKVVIVAPREALLSLDAIYGLAVVLNSLSKPRRQTPDWLADTIFGWLESGGIILDGDGREIVIGDDTIDTAHGEDGSFKWVSDVRARVSNPPRRRSRPSMLLRLQLYDAAARITTGLSIVEFGKDEGDMM